MNTSRSCPSLPRVALGDRLQLYWRRRGKHGKATGNCFSSTSSDVLKQASHSWIIQTSPLRGLSGVTQQPGGVEAGIILVVQSTEGSPLLFSRERLPTAPSSAELPSRKADGGTQPVGSNVLAKGEEGGEEDEGHAQTQTDHKESQKRLKCFLGYCMRAWKKLTEELSCLTPRQSGA